MVDALLALQWCLRTKTPAVVMSDSTELDAPRVSWREWVKRRVVGLCSSALVAGSRHRDYLVGLGMSADQISPGYDVVDNAYFAAKAGEFREQRAEVRRQHGLPENYFIASARFIGKKNLPRLIEAYARYRELAADSALRAPPSSLWDLVLLGDGPLRSDLCRLISDLRLQSFVTLPGFKQYPALPAYYGCANAFIHASTTDQWGLVVNEAMASGLPVLVSNRCGCAPDLVQEGVNGFIFDPGNVDALAQLMFRISAFNFPLSRFGAESGRIITNWGPERFAAGLKSAAEQALRAGPKPASPVDRLLLRGLIARGTPE
jgi:glycosyltransferase involved in cell wall biosynthesis